MPQARFKTEDNRKMLHKKTEKKEYKVKIHSTGKVQQPKTTQRYHTEKMEKNSTTTSLSNARFYNRKQQNCIAQRRSKETTQGQLSQSKVPQLKTTERLPTKKIENKQHKAKYVSGARFHNGTQQNGMGQRRSKTNSTTNTCISQSRFYNWKHQKDCEQRRSKRNSNKAEYLTGKVPQPKTRQIYPPEKMEKNRTSLIISQPRFHNRRQKDIYWTEKKTEVNITARFIADKVLTEVKKKIKSRRKDTNRIDEEKVSKQNLTGKRN